MVFNSLILGMLLRVVNLDQSLWMDESIGAVVAKNVSYWDIVTQFSIADNHPPLYYLTLKAWTFLFGFSEVSLRMPSVIFGVAIIYLVYHISKNKIATLLTATAPLLVYYSQEARMYIMGAFFVTLAIYLYQKNKFVLLSLIFPLMMFTDYVPVFTLPVFFIHALLSKKNVKQVLMSYIPLAVLGMIWLPIFLKQIETGRSMVEYLPEWQALAGGATIKNAILFWNKMILGRISFYPKELYYFLVAVSSVIFAYPFYTSLKKQNLLYVLWFTIPLVFGFLVSYIFPAFNYFRFIYVVPAFYILVSQIESKVFIVLMMSINLLGCGIYMFDKNQHRENWKNAVAFVEGNLAENEAIVLNYPEAFTPFQWYSKNNLEDVLPVADSISVRKNPAQTQNIVQRNVQSLSGVYYFNYLEDLTDPDKVVRNKMRDMGFVNKNTYTFNGVGEVEYLVRGK